MYKEINIIAATTKASKSDGLSKRRDNGKWMRYPSSEEDHKEAEYQHLHFVTTGSPRQGELCYYPDINEVMPFDGDYGEIWDPNKCKKLVGSTDESLGLPKPPEDFIKLYCKTGGINEVQVQYHDNHSGLVGWDIIDAIYTPQYTRPEVTEENTLIIRMLN